MHMVEFTPRQNGDFPLGGEVGGHGSVTCRIPA
jgi:hypothetical protein